MANRSMAAKADRAKRQRMALAMQEILKPAYRLPKPQAPELPEDKPITRFGSEEFKTSYGAIALSEATSSQGKARRRPTAPAGWGLYKAGGKSRAYQPRQSEKLFKADKRTRPAALDAQVFGTWLMRGGVIVE